MDGPTFLILVLLSVGMTALMLGPMYYMEGANVASFSVGLAGETTRLRLPGALGEGRGGGGQGRRRGALGERMASEWRRSGRVELDVDVAGYWETGEGRRWGYLGGNTRDKVMRCKVAADRHPSESPPCPWYSLRPHSYDMFSDDS